MVLERITAALIKAITDSSAIANVLSLIYYFKCPLEPTEKRRHFVCQVDQQTAIGPGLSEGELHRITTGLAADVFRGE